MSHDIVLHHMKTETKHLIALTTAGATEGAAIGLPYTIATAGTSPVIGAIVGGATAYSAERFMQAQREKALTKNTPATPKQESSAPVITLGNENTVVDVTVETVSSTQRTDVVEEGVQPIVKSSIEQASNVPMTDLADTLATLRSRTQANAFPAWRTTLNEKTVASTNSTATYDHAPQRVS